MAKTIADFQRDLWHDARLKTQDMQTPWYMPLQEAYAKKFNPKLYYKFPVVTFSDGSNLMCVDLNKYREDINVEMLIDMGVRCFMLRVIGPTQWVYGNWKYEVDKTFVPYYNRIRTYAEQKGVVVWIIGYGVHNAWADEQSNYTSPTDPQLALLKEAVSLQKCDSYCWDDEVAVCWKDGKETTITATNLVKSISRLMEQTWEQMERSPLGSAYHKMPIHYSANWFMKKHAMSQYSTWLDNGNKNIDYRHFLTWRAWVPSLITTSFSTIREIFAKIITPNGVQENAYLKMASELPADLWQCLFTAKGPWLGPKSSAGIDISTGYAQSLTPDDFAYCANLITSAAPPPEDECPDIEEAKAILVTTIDLANSVLAGLTSLQQKLE